MFKGQELLSKGRKLLSKDLKHMFKGLEYKIPLGRNYYPSGRKGKFPSIEKKKHRQKKIFFLDFLIFFRNLRYLFCIFKYFLYLCNRFSTDNNLLRITI